MLKKMFFFTLLCIVLIISACSKKQNNVGSYQNEVNSQTNLIYDGAKLVKFDMSAKSAIEPWDTRSNQFQYTFADSDEYITSGNSGTNDFEILEKSDNDYKSVYHLKDDEEALFPLAKIGDEYLIMVVTYSNHTSELVDLLEIDRYGKIKKMNLKLSNKAKNVFSGISSSSGDVYVLVNENDMANLYKTNQMLSEFDLIATDVGESDLSFYKDEIVYIKKDDLYSGAKRIKKLDEGTVSAKVIADKYILQVMANGSFTVEDIVTNRTLLQHNDFLGYQEDNKKINFFTIDNIYELGGGTRK
ncbi:hypothetical protein X560_0789 [Listeria fleischmannii 1991]|uniref:Lipoprotein n=2 Tax=Listeria fleischmannii TaxID=1069827 RepID=A0A2X3H5G6_9LIST|nr:hypothetical protein [Listeria fleischmannii]KMT60661.1 hypothetical protein X560_0789 [Listeria fleischmannii 1991]SQC69816.1 Uncharacterised protein [Listeria fleischmannii subsp. fleischmannii]